MISGGNNSFLVRLSSAVTIISRLLSCIIFQQYSIDDKLITTQQLTFVYLLLESIDCDKYIIYTCYVAIEMDGIGKHNYYIKKDVF